jgi:hypothetical protein
LAYGRDCSQGCADRSTTLSAISCMERRPESGDEGVETQRHIPS